MNFAVSLQYGEVIAFVTYHFPPPFQIRPIYEGRETKYTTTVEGTELLFENQEKVLEWLEKARPIIAIPATISNIEFLASEYEAKALKIFGSDIKAIGAELAKVSPRKYNSAEDMLRDCTPEYDF